MVNKKFKDSLTRTFLSRFCLVFCQQHTHDELDGFFFFLFFFKFIFKCDTQKDILYPKIFDAVA